MKTDRQLELEVVNELESDARTGQHRISAHVEQGLVTLTGPCTSVNRVAAQNAAHRVAGVLDVANEIGIEPSGLSELRDGDIARMVRAALEWEARLPDAQIQSSVSGGWVTLEGKVHGSPEHEVAGRLIGNLPGVRGVTNRLTIDTHAHAQLETIRGEIERALERRAVLEARRIQVDVADNVVNVSGEVQSWAERRWVLNAVRQTPGVASVVDELLVQPADPT
jgi:osmotically-inducible protein OsmY